MNLMAKIVFNNNEQYVFNIMGYSRNINFNDNIVNSYVYLSLAPNQENFSQLTVLGLNSITDIRILKDDDVEIHHISNITGHIESIDESLNEDSLYINVNIRLDTE